MVKNDYQQIQRAARRSRLNLSASIVYLVLFILGILVITSQLVPIYQYRFSKADQVVFKEGERPAYLSMSYAENKAYSRTELYRQDWFDLSQSNLGLANTGGSIKFTPFGREESYSVYTRIGFKYYPVAEIKNKYMFNQLSGASVTTNQGLTNDLAIPENYIGELGLATSYEKLLDFLKKNGEYRVANVKVTFNLPLERQKVEALFEKSEIELLRYGVDYPGNSNFGYPAYTYRDFNELYKLSEADFLTKLHNVTNNYTEFGNLYLYGADNFTSIIYGENEVYFNNERANFLNTTPLNFEDAQEFIETNGVNYSNILVTGTADQLALWLEEHRETIQMFEIQEVTDWNKLLMGRN